MMINKIKGLSKDLVYSIIGIGVMNAVIQLVVYPFLNERMGTEQFGDVLTLLSIVAIVGAIGTAANYSRILSHMKGYDSNGDYNRLLMYACWFAILVTIAAFLWIPMGGLRAGILFCLLLVFSIFRYYADVEFRMQLDYKKYCVYYVLVAIGYWLGTIIYPMTQSWIMVFLLGEGMAVFFVFAVGKLFQGNPLQRSINYRENAKSFCRLLLTSLLALIVLHSDRMILQEICGGTAVTIFYVATLIGKIVSLVSTPLNSVLIGYLSKYKGDIQSHTLIKICAITIPVGLIVNIFCTAVSYGFVMWKYSELLDEVRPYLFCANAGQVFYFVSGTLMVLLMRFADEKYQVYINLAYAVAFFAIAVPMTLVWGIWGMTWAVLIANILRILFICMVSIKKIN